MRLSTNRLSKIDRAEGTPFHPTMPPLCDNGLYRIVRRHSGVIGITALV